MNASIIEQVSGRTVFLAGNKKNAGKTTFLNFALNQLRTHIPMAFMTIGIDGEARDTIDDNTKPFIYTAEGDFLITTDSMLNQSDASFEIEHVFPFKTTLGRLVLAHTLRGGNIELVGCETNNQLTEAIRFLREEKQIQTILIDGAVNRMTQVASAEDGSFYFMVQVEQQSCKTDLDTIRQLSILQKLPSKKEIENFDRQKVYPLEGALTENKAKQIPKNCEVVLVHDFSRIFLTTAQLEKLLTTVQLAFEVKYSLLAFVVILKNISKAEFNQFIEKNSIQETILLNPYAN